MAPRTLLDGGPSGCAGRLHPSSVCPEGRGWGKEHETCECVDSEVLCAHMERLLWEVWVKGDLLG